MSIALVTGSAGLVGSDAVRYFSEQGMDVIGIDNDMRAYFFGKNASTSPNKRVLEKEVKGYQHLNLDITNEITAKGSVDQDGETSVGVFFERDY